MSLDAQLLAEAQVNHIYVIRLYPQARIVLRILDLLYWHSLEADRNRNTSREQNLRRIAIMIVYHVLSFVLALLTVCLFSSAGRFDDFLVGTASSSSEAKGSSSTATVSCCEIWGLSWILVLLGLVTFPVWPALSLEKKISRNSYIN